MDNDGGYDSEIKADKKQKDLLYKSKNHKNNQGQLLEYVALQQMEQREEDAIGESCI